MTQQPTTQQPTAPPDPFDNIPVRRRAYIKRKPSPGHRGTHYRKALPPAQWPMARQFMSRLLSYAEIAQDAGRPLKVGVFMTDFRKGGVE